MRSSRVRSALTRLEEWFLAPRPLQGLVGARIVFGATLFVAYALRAPAVLDLFGPSGIGGAALYAQRPGTPPFHPLIAPWLDLLRLASEREVLACYALLMASLAAFTVGFATRVAGVAAFVLHLVFWARNPIAYVSWAGWIIGPLLYVALAPVGRHLSLDAWWRRRRGAPRASWIGPGWPLRLLQIQVATMYAAAGWSRLDKPTWLSGETVMVALTSANFSRLAIDWSFAAPLLAIGTWASLVLEAGAPFLLWPRMTRRLWAGGLVAMHATLAVLIHEEIWAWSAVMTGGLLAFLLPDDELGTTPR